MIRKLHCREDARRMAKALLRTRKLPVFPLQIDETAGFFGVRSPQCEMIFARCNARLVYCRSRKNDTANRL